MSGFKNGLAKIGRVYHFKFEYKGRPYHGSTGCETRAGAEAVLRKAREDAALRARGIRPDSDAPTLEEVAVAWAHAQELRKGPGTTHVRNVMTHCGLVRDPEGKGWIRAERPGYLTPLLDERVSMITGAAAKRISDAYLAVPGNTSGGANVVLRSLYLLIGHAARRELINRRPYHQELEHVDEAPKAYLPAERIVEFFLTLQAQGAPLRAQGLCWLMLTIGLRESEARHARIEHTDLVNRWHTPYDPVVHTKGGEAKPVPICSWAVPAIAAMIGERREGFIVHGRFPGRPTKRCYTLEYVKRAGAAMGIPDLTPHCLRGSYATLLSLEGAQVKAIQGAMRHKDPRTTDRYIRPVLSSVRTAGEEIGKKAGISGAAGTLLATPAKSLRQLRKEQMDTA